MTVTIYLRSGQTITFRAETISTQRNRMTGELMSVSWEGATSGGPDYLRLDAIEAIASVYDGPDEDEA